MDKFCRYPHLLSAYMQKKTATGCLFLQSYPSADAKTYSKVTDLAHSKNVGSFFS